MALRIKNFSAAFFSPDELEPSDEALFDPEQAGKSIVLSIITKKIFLMLFILLIILKIYAVKRNKKLIDIKDYRQSLQIY